jgi:hypothetical protein
MIGPAEVRGKIKDDLSGVKSRRLEYRIKGVFDWRVFSDKEIGQINLVWNRYAGGILDIRVFTEDNAGNTCMWPIKDRPFIKVRGAPLYVNVSGPSWVRLGRKEQFFVEYGNKGYADTYDVCLTVRISPYNNVDVRFDIVPLLSWKFPSLLMRNLQMK